MKILIHNFFDQYLLEKLKQNFLIEQTDLYRPHDFGPRDHVVFLNVTDTETIKHYHDLGYKIIVSKFYDELLDDPDGTFVKDNCLYLWSRDWFWINTAALVTKNQLNYIRPPSVPDHFFLLMMNLKRAHRDELFEITKPYHGDSLYSYVELGHYLPGDAPLSNTSIGTSHQHHYNPDWYNKTMFSMVAETRVRWPAKSQTARFVSEKIFKPLAFQHPLVVYGTHGTLDYLHEHGFETFDHVVDESYDDILDYDIRLEAIGMVLETLHERYQQGEQLFSDSVSREKILHNYHNFYNTNKLNQLWNQQIINPIREFVNA